MTKKNTIIVSILLIISAAVIEFLMNYSKTQINEHFGFFAGFLSGAGLSMLIKLFFGKKTKDLKANSI
jgi:hypothetical protein